MKESEKSIVKNSSH